MADLDNDHIDASISHFLAHSKVKSNGITEVTTDAYYDRLKEKGVTKEDVARVYDAVDELNSAGAKMALDLVEQKYSEASDEDKKSEAFRRNLSATVRLPSYKGATEITAHLEKVSPIPFKQNAEGTAEQQYKTTHGRIGIAISTKRRIHPDIHKSGAAKMRTLLGLEEVEA